MPEDTLEQVRLLSNLESSRHKLLQIVLFGQPELDEALAKPSMRQLKDRITHSFRTRPLAGGRSREVRLVPHARRRLQGPRRLLARGDRRDRARLQRPHAAHQRAVRQVAARRLRRQYARGDAARGARRGRRFAISRRIAGPPGRASAARSPRRPCSRCGAAAGAGLYYWLDRARTSRRAAAAAAESQPTRPAAACHGAGTAGAAATRREPTADSTAPTPESRPPLLLGRAIAPPRGLRAGPQSPAARAPRRDARKARERAGQRATASSCSSPRTAIRARTERFLAARARTGAPAGGLRDPGRRRVALLGCW